MSINITVPGEAGPVDRDFGYGYSPGAVRYEPTCASVRASSTVYADTYIVGPNSYTWKPLALGGNPALDDGTERPRAIALPGVVTGALVRNQNWGDCIYRVDFDTPGVHDSISGARGELVTVARNSTAKFIVDGTEYTAAANQSRVGRNGLIVEPGCTNSLSTTDLTQWSLGDAGADVVRAAVAGPLGATDAISIRETATTAQRYVYTTSGGSKTGKWTVSVYAKAFSTGSKRWLAIGWSDSATRWAIFDLVTGTCATETGDGVPQIVPAGNGWYRCSLHVAAITGSSQSLLLCINNSATTFAAYAGDNTSGIYLWRPQLEQNNNYATRWQDVGDVRAAEIATTVAPSFGEPHGIEVVATPAGDQNWIRGSAEPIVSFGTNGAADTLRLYCVSGTSRYSTVNASSAERHVDYSLLTEANIASGPRTLFCASNGATKPAQYFEGMVDPAAAASGAGNGVVNAKAAASRLVRIGCDSTSAVSGLQVQSLAIYSSDKLPPIEPPYNGLTHQIAHELCLAADRIAFVGHSWVKGVGSDTITERYTHKAARTMGAQYAEHNYGVGSNTSSQTLDICRRYVWRHGYGRVLVDTIINDVGAGYPAAVILANIATIVAEAKAAGATKVVVVNGAPGNANNTVTLAVNAGLAANATAWGCTVVDSYTLFDDPGNSGHMKATHGDGLHSSQVGFDALAVPTAAALA